MIIRQWIGDIALAILLALPLAALARPLLPPRPATLPTAQIASAGTLSASERISILGERLY